MHIHYNIPSLVNKRGLSGRSIWDLEENSGSKASYGKGTCPVLDAMTERSMLLCVASTLSGSDVEDIVKAMKKVLDRI